MNLALKYRPKSFDDVVGQKAICVVLQAMIKKEKLSQVLLFTGASGVGKTSMARIIAAQLNSEAAQEVFAGTHPAVLEIDAASNGSVDRIRKLKIDTSYATSGHRVVIIDEIQAISDQGFTALLYLLEFPPPNTTFILITTEGHVVPKTIRHRSDAYTFVQASVADIYSRLSYVNEQENFGVSDELLNLIAERSEGSYRESLMILDRIAAAEIVSVEDYNNLQGEIDFGPSLIKACLSGSSTALAQLDSILRYTTTENIIERSVEILKDLILLKSNLPCQCSGAALDSRKNLADKLTKDKLVKAIHIIWDLQTKLSAGNPVRGLEMAYTLLGEIFYTPVDIPEKITVQSQKMNFKDMLNSSR